MRLSLSFRQLAAVVAEFAGRAELTEFVSNHIFCDKYWDVNLAVVDSGVVVPSQAQTSVVAAGWQQAMF